jgi:hypothetical protein
MVVGSNTITDAKGTYTFTQNGSNGGPSNNRTKFASYNLELSSTFYVTTSTNFITKAYGSAVTYEAWIWVNNRSSEFVIVNNHDGTQYQSKWYINTSGAMLWRPYEGGSDHNFNLTVPTGQWNHVVMQVSAADGNDRAVILAYLNGTRGTAGSGSAQTVIQAGSQDTRIGPAPGIIESLQISNAEKYGGNPTMSPGVPAQELTQAYQNGL